MPVFRYTATNADNESVSGTLTATSVDAARGELSRMGLRIETLTDQTFEKITDQQARDVGQHIADLTQAGLPVGDGLRALSYELATESFWPSRTPTLLRSIANRLDAGESLLDVMAAYRTPHDLQSIMAAGMKTGRVPEAVGEYTAHVQAVNATSRFAAVSMAYPLLVILAVMAIAGFAFGAVVPQFKTIFEDFGIELPGITVVIINISDIFQPVFAPFAGSLTRTIAGVLIFLAALVLLPWLIWNALSFNDGMKRFRNRLPVIGRIFQWSSMAKFSHLVAVLINQNVPLADALRFAGRGSEDPDIDDACQDLAQQVDEGQQPLLVQKLAGFPTGFLQLLASQSDQDGIPEAMHSIANMYEGRMRMQSAVIVAIMEPFILVFVIGLPVATMVLALFMPLIKLLNDLS